MVIFGRIHSYVLIRSEWVISTGGVVYNAGADVHVLRLANGHQETEEVEGERASPATCSGEDLWLRAMEASHRQSEARRPQLHSEAQS